MSVNKPLTIVDKPFRAMNVNPSKEKKIYTQGQQFAAKVLLAVWLLASVIPANTLAIPKRQDAITPATTISLQGSPLVSTPPKPLPRGTLQLPSDSPGSFGDSSASNTLARAHSLRQCIIQQATPEERYNLPRTSPQISQADNNLPKVTFFNDSFPFQAQGGEKVHFAYQQGQWHAEVSSHIGSASRRAVLSVVCSQGNDVASSLEVLRKYPSWYIQRQIHVLDRNTCPTLGEVVYVGALGLKGGSGREVSGSGIPQGEHTTNQLEATKDYYENELATEEHCFGPNHPNVASALMHLGDSWRALGDARKAISFYERALAMYE